MRALLTSSCLAMLLCACSTPTDHFYTLIGDAPPGPANASGPTVLIASVALPEGVDRSELVLRRGGNSVAVMDTQRWAESLKSAIARVLANNMGPQLGAMVATRDDNLGQSAQYQVRVDVTRFDTVLGGTEALDATWSVQRLHDGGNGPVLTGRSSLRMQAKGSAIEDAVAAHSEALIQLSGDIANKIKEMEKSGN